MLAYIQDSYHTDSSAGGDTVARQLGSMEDKLDTILISLLTILPRLDKIDNEVQNIKDGQTVLKRRIKAVDATMAEHSAMVIASANETKVHLSREVLKLYEKLSKDNDNLSSQSNALTRKVNSLSTQTQSLTSSVDTLASNTGTLTTRVDLVASRMDGVTSAVGSLGERTDTLTTTTSSLVSSTEGLTTKVNFLDTQVYTLTSEVKIVSSDVKYLNSTVVSLESHTNNLTTTVTSLLFSNRALTSTLHYTTTTLTNTVSTLNFQVGNLYEKLSEATNNLSSQSHALTIKVGFLSTQTQSLTSSVDTLSSNTGTLTTRVDLVASQMDGLTCAFTDSPLSIQVQNLTSLAGMANDMLQDIRQDQTLSLIVDKIPYNVKSSSSCMQLSEDYPMANSGYYWMIDQTGSPVSTYCFINSELNPASSCQQLAQDHPYGESDYYWVKDDNGTAINTDCIITSQLNPASSCQQLAQDHPYGESDYYWVKDDNGTAINTDCIITSQLNPASSCQQLAQDHPFGESDFYWVKDENGTAINTDCIITSELNPASSCQQLARDHPHAASGYYWVIDEGTAINTDCIINSELNPASSCQQLAQDHPHAASDYYWVSNGTTQPVRVYCDMDQHCCNSTGGWVRVANIDMTDTNQQCPPGFNLRTDIRSCNRSESNIGCTPITFPSHGIEYRQVCGRIRAYQYWDTLAFWPYYLHRSITIEDRYVYGMSLTHGRHPRQHIWTFASARSEYYSHQVACPCTRTNQPYPGPVPPFIGDDYFCDTAITATQRYSNNVVYADDPLWDGQGCGPTSTCCSFNRPPWFCKQLPQATTDDLELRVCGDRYRKTPFDQIEIFIH